MEKMSTEENKWTRLVNKLIELTQKDSLKWTYLEDETVKEKPGDIINASYYCIYKGKNIRIVSYNTLDFYNSGIIGSFSFSNPFEKPSGNKEWITKIKIEIGSGEVGWWEIPYTSNSNDLLDTIKFKASGAQGVINDLLSEA